jgi:peptide/nickel transport system substrate-binding protein
VNTYPHFLSSFRTKLAAKIYGMRKWERTLFYPLLIITVFSSIGLITHISHSFSHNIPAHGGHITEGILGTPRFINPVLANSDIDEDLTKIVYSGLMREISHDGNTALIPDLAESYTVSPDGKTYTFIIKKDAVFHDKKHVTADDVVFTINEIQNIQINSPLLNEWSGVSVSALDTKTVQIVLPRAFSGFLKSTTIGILPKHIWSTMTTDEFIASTRNNNPIGSGPYKIESIERNRDGIPVKYVFSKFNKFTLGHPFLNKISIKLYSNRQDLLNGYEQNDFETVAGLQSYEITNQNSKFAQTAPLPRMFGLFMNSSKNSLLADENIVRIIRNAIHTDEIITTVFQGNAQKIDSPLPKLSQHSPSIEQSSPSTLNTTLESMGWKLNSENGLRSKNGKPLTFTISTADTPELKYTAQIIQQQLKSVGIATELHVFPISDLETSVIKSRSFEILLFGQLIRNDADLYAFWHSSQKSDPGLNITGYSKKSVDNNLEKLFTVTDPDERAKILESLHADLIDAPVIWLYQPYFIYIFKKPIYGINLGNLISKHDRFNTIYQWYTKTDMVWNVFKK